MDSARRRRIVEILDVDPTLPPAERLCVGAAELLDMPAIGISVMSEGRHLGTVCATAPAERTEALQFELGEGPCVEAHLRRHPVLIADLAMGDSWPAFRAAAREGGVRAAFCFPLEVGSVRLGVLSMYRGEVGELSTKQQEDALLVARFGVELLLNGGDDGSTGPFPALLTALDLQEWEVHQATGMVAVQVGVGVEDAFALLRGHAYAAGRPLREVAADVVARRLRLSS